MTSRDPITRPTASRPGRSPRGPLGALEQLVVLAVLRLAGGAYGVAVRDELLARTGRSVSLGAVYSTLDRLEAKGLVRSRSGAASKERGGRARRWFEVTAAGRRALQCSLEQLDRMRDDLTDFRPLGAPA